MPALRRYRCNASALGIGSYGRHIRNAEPTSEPDGSLRVDVGIDPYDVTATRGVTPRAAASAAHAPRWFSEPSVQKTL